MTNSGPLGNKLKGLRLTEVGSILLLCCKSSCLSGNLVTARPHKHNLGLNDCVACEKEQLQTKETGCFFVFMLKSQNNPHWQLFIPLPPEL